MGRIHGCCLLYETGSRLERAAFSLATSQPVSCCTHSCLLPIIDSLHRQMDSSPSESVIIGASVSWAVDSSYCWLVPPLQFRRRGYVHTITAETPAFTSHIKPGPHQQQCRSNIVECYNVECCFDIVAQNGNIVEETGQSGLCPFRSFRYASPCFWNQLPLSLCQPLSGASSSISDSSLPSPITSASYDSPLCSSKVACCFDSVASTLLLVSAGLNTIRCPSTLIRHSRRRG